MGEKATPHIDTRENDANNTTSDKKAGKTDWFYFGEKSVGLNWCTLIFTSYYSNNIT